MGFLLGNFLLTIGLFANVVLQLYGYVVIATVVISWLPVDRGHPIIHLLDQLVAPPLAWLRRHLPFLVQGGLDLSPMALWILIQVVRSVAAGGLIDAAHRL
ncbi:MAG: YggT family protein [bacterium]